MCQHTSSLQLPKDPYILVKEICQMANGLLNDLMIHNFGENASNYDALKQYLGQIKKEYNEINGLSRFLKAKSRSSATNAVTALMEKYTTHFLINLVS